MSSIFCLRTGTSDVNHCTAEKNTDLCHDSVSIVNMTGILCCRSVDVDFSVICSHSDCAGSRSDVGL